MRNAPSTPRAERGEAVRASLNFTRAIRSRIQRAHTSLVRYIADRLDLNQLVNLLPLVGFVAGVSLTQLAHAIAGGGL